MSTIRHCLLLVLALGLGGCSTVSGNPLILRANSNPEPKGDEQILRGVVNGLWKFDPEKTYRQLAKYDEHLTPEQLTEYSGRYVVRVGIDRGAPIEILSPIPLGKWVEFVVLPAGWSHDIHAISADPTIINVGDIVDVRAKKGTYYDFLEALVRQCDAAPAAEENKDWALGCKTFDRFDEEGFAGDYHYWRSF